MVAADLNAVAHAKLKTIELAALEHCPGARRRRFRAGEVLLRTGESGCRFFVVCLGEVAIIDETTDPPRTITVLGPGEFTGDATQLTGAASLVSAVARTDVEALEVSSEGVRQLINRSPGLGDTILQAFIARNQILRDPATYTGVRVIGSRHSRNTFRIRDFLAKNRIPFVSLDLESEPHVRQLLQTFGVTEAETPIVAWGRVVLRNPSERVLADVIGLRRAPDQRLHDVVVVGAGPAGLAAAVYGSSEGLDTVVLERSGPGGQAGRSMRIENYLGFPTGITGAELADRAALQAAKFGANLAIASMVIRLAFDGPYDVLELDDGQRVEAKCVVVASGADYRRLDADGVARFEGTGVYYAATPLEAPLCRKQTAVIVGGGNSAGQAAVFLSEYAQRVVMVVRADSLGKSMSSYLVERIQQTENIEVLLQTIVRRLVGDEWLRAIEVVQSLTHEERTITTPALFSFIGAEPRTDWLPDDVERDAKGFVLTGVHAARSPHWKASRDPFLLETTRAGVFAAGDVRSGSVKRVASAVGEGAMAIHLVHEYLKTM